MPQDADCAEFVHGCALLREIGATDSMDAIDVTLENPMDGNKQTVAFESLTEYAYDTSTILPLADTLLQHGTYRATLAEAGTLFIQYNECTNDENMPMKDFAAALEAQLTSAPEKIIVDLRHNGGGDSSVIQPLIQLLQKYEEQGKPAFCADWCGTFSSAVMNAGGSAGKSAQRSSVKRPAGRLALAN